MKIEDNRNNHLEFRDLVPGDVFTTFNKDNDYYLKVCYDVLNADTDGNVINLRTCCRDFVLNYTEVVKLSAKLVIE